MLNLGSLAVSVRGIRDVTSQKTFAVGSMRRVFCGHLIHSSVLLTLMEFQLIKAPNRASKMGRTLILYAHKSKKHAAQM